MCAGPLAPPSPPKDNSAEIARQQQLEREGRIREGRTKIDETFAPFNDDYFGGIQTDYTDYYKPQLEDQYEQARRQLILNLSKSGNGQSTAGARALGGLSETYGKNQGLIADRSEQARNDLRARVEAARQDLYGQNASSADPSSVASAAVAQAGNLRAPQAYSPLGDVFASLLNNSANVVAAEAAGHPGFRTGLFPAGGGRQTGSSRVVS